MSHEYEFALAKFRLLVVLDMVYTLCQLIDVSVEMSKAPRLVGGCEVESEDGPFGCIEGVYDISHVGCCSQSISKATYEEEAVWLGYCTRRVFKGYEGFSLN